MVRKLTAGFILLFLALGLASAQKPENRANLSAPDLEHNVTLLFRPAVQTELALTSRQLGDPECGTQ